MLKTPFYNYLMSLVIYISALLCELLFGNISLKTAQL